MTDFDTHTHNAYSSLKSMYETLVRQMVEKAKSGDTEGVKADMNLVIDAFNNTADSCCRLSCLVTSLKEQLKADEGHRGPG